LFEALDVDGSGQVSINEFFDGVCDVVFSKAGLHMKRMEMQVETVHWRVKEMFQFQHDLLLSVKSINEKVNRVEPSPRPPNARGTTWKRSTDADRSMPPWMDELTCKLRTSFDELMVQVHDALLDGTNCDTSRSSNVNGLSSTVSGAPKGGAVKGPSAKAKSRDGSPARPQSSISNASNPHQRPSISPMRSRSSSVPRVSTVSLRDSVIGKPQTAPKSNGTRVSKTDVRPL